MKYRATLLPFSMFGDKIKQKYSRTPSLHFDDVWAKLSKGEQKHLKPSNTWLLLFFFHSRSVITIYYIEHTIYLKRGNTLLNCVQDLVNRGIKLLNCAHNYFFFLAWLSNISLNRDIKLHRIQRVGQRRKGACLSRFSELMVPYSLKVTSRYFKLKRC